MLRALREAGRGVIEAVGDFDDPSSERENSHPIDVLVRLGGGTTLHYAHITTRALRHEAPVADIDSGDD